MKQILLKIWMARYTLDTNVMWSWKAVMLMNLKTQWCCTVKLFFVIKCFCAKKFLCVKCSFLLYFFIERNKEKSNIEIHVHHLYRNIDKYSRDQLMNCSLPHCLYTQSADSLLAMFLQSMHSFTRALSHIHTHTHTATYWAVEVVIHCSHSE